MAALNYGEDVWSENSPSNPQDPYTVPKSTTQPAAPPVSMDPAQKAPNQAQQPAAAPSGPWGPAGDANGWLNSQLDAVQSTDSRDYWQQQAAKDPKFMAGDPGAMAWWKDAIERGDGSALVKSGQLQKRGGGGAPGGMGGGSSSFSFSGSTASQDPRWAALFDQLQKRGQQSLNVDPNDPVIRSQTDAYDAQQVRAGRQNLSALAESLGPGANMGAEVRRAGESRGQNDAAFLANLQAREVDARRQEIAAALAGQMGVLSAADAFKLKTEDQTLAQQALALQGQLGNRGLDLTAQNQGWNQGFQDRGWDADQQQRAWEDQYKTIFG